MGFFSFFKKKEIELSDEEKKWNKMWDMWTEEQVNSPYKELMTYQGEVNNGGHGQYYDNVNNVSDLKKEISELNKILPKNLKDNLNKGYKAFLILEENYDEEADKILDECDNVFYDNEEEINQLLKDYASKIEL